MFGHWCRLFHLETKTLCNSRKVGLETKPIQTGWITGIQIVDKCLLQNITLLLGLTGRKSTMCNSGKTFLTL